MTYEHKWDDVFEVAQILKKALSRCEKGQKEYGVYEPDTDGREMLGEMEDELLDSIVYACFQIIKLRRMRNRLG